MRCSLRWPNDATHGPAVTLLAASSTGGEVLSMTGCDERKNIGEAVQCQLLLPEHETQTGYRDMTVKVTFGSTCTLDSTGLARSASGAPTCPAACSLSTTAQATTIIGADNVFGDPVSCTPQPEPTQAVWGVDETADQEAQHVPGSLELNYTTGDTSNGLAHQGLKNWGGTNCANGSAQVVPGLGKGAVGYYCEGSMEVERNGADVRLTNSEINPAPSVAAELPAVQSALANLGA
jgi:hypothetical protein